MFRSIVLITPETDEIVCNRPQNVPSKPKKTSKPIMYLKISLLSSNLDETPSKIVLRELADSDGLSFLFSERTAATGAKRIGFILSAIFAGIRLSFFLINLSHLASLLNL